MNTNSLIIAALSGVAVCAGVATAQEQPKPKVKKAKVIRAMRLTTGLVGGKPPTQEVLAERHAKKMGEAWVQNAKWITDFDAAQAQAEESGKRIFAYFTRSYAP